MKKFLLLGIIFCVLGITNVSAETVEFSRCNTSNSIFIIRNEKEELVYLEGVEENRYNLCIDLNLKTLSYIENSSNTGFIISNNESINELIVKKGYSKFTGTTNLNYKRILCRAEKTAEESHLGIWQDNSNQPNSDCENILNSTTENNTTMVSNSDKETLKDWNRDNSPLIGTILKYIFIAIVIIGIFYMKYKTKKH